MVLKFNELVVETRKKKLMTQSELSIEAQVTKEYLSNIEAGKFIPGFSVAKRILDVLGISYELGSKCLEESKNERKEN